MRISQRTDELILHNQTTSNAEGNALDVRGCAVAVLTVTGVFRATITVESSIDGDGGGWVAIPAVSMETGKSVSELTAGRFLVLIKGAHRIRARISRFESGSITVTGRAIDSDARTPAHTGSEISVSDNAPVPTQVVLEPEIPPAITQVSYPAYMVNRNWDIEWINDRAEELIFGRSVRKIANIEDRHFFKLLFTTSVRDMVTDFDCFVKSHLPLVQGDIPNPSRNPILAHPERREHELVGAAVAQGNEKAAADRASS